MPWYNDLLDKIEQAVPGGYLPGGPIAAEPMAWSALSLVMAGRAAPARRAADWLAAVQQPSGAVGVLADHESPAWPTSLALLAWRAVQDSEHTDAYQENIAKGVQWALNAKGRVASRSSEVGHDPMLVGWSWAADTHTWLEPTAMFVRALTAVGLADHPRALEGVSVVVDRLLPTGGANYGNTTVLGQALLPHTQPTGLALWALAGRDIDDPRVGASIDLLGATLSASAATASMAYGLLGMTAHGARPADADAWLEAAYRRQPAARPSLYKLSLLALALGVGATDSLAVVTSSEAL